MRGPRRGRWGSIDETGFWSNSCGALTLCHLWGMNGCFRQAEWEPLGQQGLRATLLRPWQGWTLSWFVIGNENESRPYRVTCASAWAQPGCSR